MHMAGHYFKWQAFSSRNQRDAETHRWSLRTLGLWEVLLPQWQRRIPTVKSIWNWSLPKCHVLRQALITGIYRHHLSSLISQARQPQSSAQSKACTSPSHHRNPAGEWNKNTGPKRKKQAAQTALQPRQSELWRMSLSGLWSRTPFSAGWGNLNTLKSFV